MSYAPWNVGQPTETSHTPRAFVFDGWSHEPLVLDKKERASAAAHVGVNGTTDQRVASISHG